MVLNVWLGGDRCLLMRSTVLYLSLYRWPAYIACGWFPKISTVLWVWQHVKSAGCHRTLLFGITVLVIQDLSVCSFGMSDLPNHSGFYSMLILMGWFMTGLFGLCFLVPWHLQSNVSKGECQTFTASRRNNVLAISWLRFSCTMKY